MHAFDERVRRDELAPFGGMQNRRIVADAEHDALVARALQRVDQAVDKPELADLGDLAGGQIVGKVLERVYGLTGPGALFYDFSALGSPSRFRTRYRALLDAAPWDEIERRRVTDEAVRAFELNIAMLDGMAEATGLPAAA